MKAEPLDSGDLDAILDLERSPGYLLVRGRLEAELTRLRKDLEGPADPIATATIRGAISGTRVALSIPEILKGEINGKEQSKEQSQERSR